MDAGMDADKGEVRSRTRRAVPVESGSVTSSKKLFGKVHLFPFSVLLDSE